MSITIGCFRQQNSMWLRGQPTMCLISDASQRFQIAFFGSHCQWKHHQAGVGTQTPSVSIPERPHCIAVIDLSSFNLMLHATGHCVLVAGNPVLRKTDHFNGTV